MSSFKQKKYIENFDRDYDMTFVGAYDIPLLNRVTPEEVKVEPDSWISFHEAKSFKGDRSKTGIHFYTYDNMFERVWNDPERYGKMLSEYACVLSPDFSLYTDFPLALQIWNHYRKHWMGAYWQQEMGLTVIPTICWSTPESFSWCFSGEPRHSVVSVSSWGCVKNPTVREAFLKAYKVFTRRCQPSVVLWFGEKLPIESEENVVYCESNQQKIVRRLSNERVQRKREEKILWEEEAHRMAAAEGLEGSNHPELPEASQML